MELLASVPTTAKGTSQAKTPVLDLGLLPQTLASQCRSLIESYHDIHGYACLPNMLWRAQLGDFIKKQPCLRQILRRASTTRSAKLSNKGFVEIATVILALEILASDFASWSAMFPNARSIANALLRNRGSRLFLMEYYLYPPKHISPAVLAALSPPAGLDANESGRHDGLSPELAGQRQALSYASTMREASKVSPCFPWTRATSSA